MLKFFLNHLFDTCSRVLQVPFLSRDFLGFDNPDVEVLSAKMDLRNRVVSMVDLTSYSS